MPPTPKLYIHALLLNIFPDFGTFLLASECEFVSVWVQRILHESDKKLQKNAVEPINQQRPNKERWVIICVLRLWESDGHIQIQYGTGAVLLYYTFQHVRVKLNSCHFI